jgi:hypothetical protein
VYKRSSLSGGENYFNNVDDVQVGPDDGEVDVRCSADSSNPPTELIFRVNAGNDGVIYLFIYLSIY